VPSTTSQEFVGVFQVKALTTSFPGGNSEWEPPDPIPNSEVKLLSADDSVGLPHVKVGHCQDLIPKNPCIACRGFFFLPQGWGDRQGLLPATSRRLIVKGFLAVGARLALLR
jgi:hypothetical protein